MEIYLIRHGRQSSPLCNVNVELSQEGHRQAQLVGERLSRYQIQGLYSSVLIRAQQTAEHIKEYVNLPIVTALNIQEIDFGDWEGQSDDALQEQYGQMRQQHSNGLADIHYPNGESGQTCYERYAKGMEWIVGDAMEKGYDNIAVVTHGLAMRSFLCGTFQIPFAKRGLLAKSLENGSITQLGYSKDGGYTLERFNDYAHLEPYDELLRKHFIPK